MRSYTIICTESMWLDKYHVCRQRCASKHAQTRLPPGMYTLAHASTCSHSRAHMQGSLQLATDLEYICNVVTALGVALPPPLATACILTPIVPEADFNSTAAAGVADGSLDKRTCATLAAMRGFSPS